MEARPALKVVSDPVIDDVEDFVHELQESRLPLLQELGNRVEETIERGQQEAEEEVGEKLDVWLVRLSDLVYDSRDDLGACVAVTLELARICDNGHHLRQAERAAAALRQLEDMAREAYLEELTQRSG